MDGGGVNGYNDENAQWNDNSNSVFNADDVSTDEASNDASNFGESGESSNFRFQRNRRNFDLSQVNTNSPVGVKNEDPGADDDDGKDDDDSLGYMTGWSIFPSHSIDSRPGSPREGDRGRSDTPSRGRGRGRGGRSNTPVLDIPCYRDSVSAVTYHRGDCVYLDNKWPDQPYHVCTIQEFRLSKRDELLVDVKFYFRASEVPDNVYQLLVQDRKEKKEQVDLLADAELLTRELFISNASDSFPVSALRGKCSVVAFSSLSSIADFEADPDAFFYLLGYNPETKRLATLQGEIRGRPQHMARLPEYRANVKPEDMAERCEMWEELNWRPSGVVDGDLIMYLRAVRSMAAFAGMCDGGSTEDGCNAASMDETTINALDTLHRNLYDTGKALQELVKKPVPRSIEKKWNEEETKRFVKGLRQYGKNFFRIRKELLPFKETGELVEYYYYWKKTPGAANNRPHRRHRRTNVFRRNNRPSRPPSTGVFCDLSSASEVSDNESDDSDSRDLSGYACRHCFTTTSKDWHHAGKDRALLCTECRVFFKKYGEERPVDKRSPPPFMFKPVKDDETVNGKHTMRTRRRKDNGTGKVRPKKDRQTTSSPDNLDSPLTSGSSKETGRKSPSTASTCSSSSTDNKDKRNNKAKEAQAKNRKRNAENSESEDKANKKKKPQDRAESPIESSTDSSSVCGNDNEENGHEGDPDQDDLSSSGSSVSSPVAAITSEEPNFKLPAPRSPVSSPPPPQNSLPEVEIIPDPDTHVTPLLIVPKPKVGEANLSPVSSVATVTSSDIQLHTSNTAFQAVPSSASVITSQHSVPASHALSLPPPGIPHSFSPAHSVQLPASLSQPAFSASSQGLPASPADLRPVAVPVVQHIRPLAAGPTLLTERHTVSPEVRPIEVRPLSSAPAINGSDSVKDSSTSTTPAIASSGTQVPFPPPPLLSQSQAPSLSRALTPPKVHTATLPIPTHSSAPPGGPPPLAPAGPPQPQMRPPHPTSLPQMHPNSHAPPHPAGQPPGHPNSHPASHPSSHPPSHPPSHPNNHPSSHPNSHPASHPNSHPSPHSNSHPGLHPSSHPSQHPNNHPPPPSHPNSHPSSHPNNHPSQHPNSHPSSHPTSHAPSHPNSHSTPHPTSHAPTHPNSHPSPLPAGHPAGHPPGHPTGHPASHPAGHPAKTSSSPTPPFSQHSQGIAKPPALSHLPHPPALSVPASLGPPGGAGIYPPPGGPHRLVPGAMNLMSSPYHPSSLMKPEQPRSPPPLTQPPRSPAAAGPPAPGAYPPPSRSPLKSQSPPRSRSPLQPPPSSLPSVPISQPQQQLSPGRPRSRSPLQLQDSDSEPEPPRSPSPEPRVVNEQCYKSTNAIFIKRLWRGYNTCCRCDFEFRPLPDSNLARKREERLKKASQPPSTRTPPPAPAPQPHAAPIKEERREEKKEEEKPGIPKPESPNKPSLQPPSQPQQLPPYDRHTPGRVPYPPSHDPTPALRQLSEYARPHALGQEPSRPLPYSLPSLPPHDPMLHYRMAAMYPPGSRERLELELQRDKQERDERERELRERQLRELEFREKMKQELEMKPPGSIIYTGFDRLLPPGANPLDPHWAAELQRRFSGGHPGGHIPGVYPPASLASDLMRQERERLERLGLATLGHPPDAAIAERLAAERLYAERMALAAADPLLRHAALSAQGGAHAHAHAHAHSHTHLHLHQGGSGSGDPRDPPGVPPHGNHHLVPGYPGPLHFPEAPGASQSEHARAVALYQYYQRMHPTVDPNLLAQRLMHCPPPTAAKPPELEARGLDASHLVYHFSRGAGGTPGAAGAPPGSSTPVSPHLPSPHGLPPSHPLVAAAREQEMMYRDLLSRPPYSTDPLLAHQLTAQAAAHHEALQRQLALERERLGAHLPH